MSSLRSHFIRTLFATVEHLTPRLAGRFAFELFIRPERANRRVSEREQRALDEAAPAMAEAERHWIAGRDGKAIAAFEFPPLAPEATDRADTVRTALVVHGWNSRTEHLWSVIEILRRSGFRVIAFDLPGHGQSSGRSLHIGGAVAAVNAVLARLGPAQLVVGHSFGGAVSVNAVAGSIAGYSPVPAERLVLIAAPSDLPFIFRRFAGMLGLGPRSRDALYDRVAQVAARPLASFVGGRQLAETGLPALVIHAPEDREVPASQASDYARDNPLVRLHWAPGLGHRRILSDRAVLAEIARFALAWPAIRLVKDSDHEAARGRAVAIGPGAALAERI